MTKKKSNRKADKPHIAKGLQALAVRADSLSEDPANLRLHDDRNVNAIASSIRRYGQQKPIVVDDSGTCIAGRGTLRAMRDVLKCKHVAVVQSELEGHDKTGYAIADNRITDLSEFDLPALAESLESLPDDLAEIAGFDDEDMKELLAGLTLPDNADGKEYDESCADDVKMTTCPKCGVEYAL